MIYSLLLDRKQRKPSFEDDSEASSRSRSDSGWCAVSSSFSVFSMSEFIMFSNSCGPLASKMVFERVTRLSACSHPYTVAVPRCRAKSYSGRFFPRTASLLNSLPGACFPSSYDLLSFKRNINSYLQLH